MVFLPDMKPLLLLSFTTVIATVVMFPLMEFFSKVTLRRDTP